MSSPPKSSVFIWETPAVSQGQGAKGFSEAKNHIEPTLASLEASVSVSVSMWELAVMTGECVCVAWQGILPEPTCFLPRMGL